MRKLATLIASVCLSSTVMAEQNSTVFACTTSDGQHLSVKKVGTHFEFSSGNLNFKNPVKQALKYNDSAIAGGSGFITYSLELHNKGLKYVVGYIAPRGNNSEMIEPGASVQNIKTGQFMESILCDPKKAIKANFDKKLMRQIGFASY